MSNEKVYEYPARNSLIAAIAMTALYGLEQSETDILRVHELYSDTTANIDNNLCILEIRRVYSLISHGQPALSSSRRIAECLAYARQLAHVTAEEWESVIQFTRPTKKL